MAHFTKSVTEVIGITETRKRHFRRYQPDEFVGIAEQPDYPRTFYEAVQLTEAAAHSITFARGFAEALTIAEDSTRHVYKNIFEEAAIADTLGRHFFKNISENITVRDTITRNANAVLFDLVLRSDVLTVDDLTTVTDSPPVGYSPFQNFYPGDYEFREAMVGVRIRSFDTTGRPGILGLQHNVDVPDITERGQATVTAGEAAGTGEHTVVFSKEFTDIPEVYPTWKDGPTAAVAELISVTTSQFVFILRDVSSPATKVEGTITWAAIGR